MSYDPNQPRQPYEQQSNQPPPTNYSQPQYGQQPQPQFGQPQYGQLQQQYGQPQQPFQPQYGGPPVLNYAQAQQKDWLTTLLLCIFLGGLGVHRFYTGHTVFGVIQLLTLGGCGIWVLVDLIMIVTENYRDSNGLPLVKR